MLAVIGFIAIVGFILKLVIENIKLKAQLSILKFVIFIIAVIIVLMIIF